MHTDSHRIHGAGIYANIWGMLMVNVTIYSIHGSYGIGREDKFKEQTHCCMSFCLYTQT
jgi:hypothetical protein